MYIRVRTYLFGQRFLSPRDNEQIIKENEIHFGGFSRVEEVEGTLLQDLASRAHDQPLTGLAREGALQELGEVLLRIHLQDGRPYDAPLDLQQPVEILQPFHLVVKLP